MGLGQDLPHQARTYLTCVTRSGQASSTLIRGLPSFQKKASSEKANPGKRPITVPMALHARRSPKRRQPTVTRFHRWCPTLPDHHLLDRLLGHGESCPGWLRAPFRVPLGQVASPPFRFRRMPPEGRTGSRTTSRAPTLTRKPSWGSCCTARLGRVPLPGSSAPSPVRAVCVR